MNCQTRIPELDGLRGIAIGMVLIWHFFAVPARFAPATLLAYTMIPLRLLWTGVDLFFVLSGFLIGGILLDARDSSNYFRVFYTRRFFRIVPAYALTLLSVFAFSWVLQFGLALKFRWLNRVIKQVVCHQHNPLKMRSLLFVLVGARLWVFVEDGHKMGTGARNYSRARIYSIQLINVVGHGHQFRPATHFALEDLSAHAMTSDEERHVAA